MLDVESFEDIKELVDRIAEELENSLEFSNSEKEEIKNGLVDPYSFPFEDDLGPGQKTIVDHFIVFQDHVDFKRASLVIYNKERDLFGLGYRSAEEKPGCFIGYYSGFLDALKGR